MGSGKSTVGRLLARQLGRSFHDLDELIEKEQKMSISEIFESRGEPFFRELELHILIQATARPPAVIALGGGTFVRAGNREVVEKNGISVWLQIPLQLARERCMRIGNRPLARDPAQFESLFQSRQHYYQLANLHVPVEGKSPEQLCAEIHNQLRGRIN